MSCFVIYLTLLYSVAQDRDLKAAFRYLVREEQDGATLGIDDVQRATALLYNTAKWTDEAVSRLVTMLWAMLDNTQVEVGENCYSYCRNRC